MATNKPRLSVTLPENIYRTLSELSRLQSASMSSIIVDLLETVHPPLLRTVALLQAAHDAPQEVKDGLLSAFEGMEKELSEAAGIAERQLDLLDVSLGVAKGANPHVVTRGSGRGEVRDKASGTEAKKPYKTRG